MYISECFSRDNCSMNFDTFIVRLIENPRKLERPGIETGPAVLQLVTLPQLNTGNMTFCLG